eukprot:SAG31_NODE_46025_length_256_cov_0.662420_1_plen_69_part_10
MSDCEPAVVDNPVGADGGRSGDQRPEAAAASESRADVEAALQELGQTDWGTAEAKLALTAWATKLLRPE